MESLEQLQQVLIDELKDLYSAEKQLVKALPKLAKAANDSELRQALVSHMAETEEHVTRLDRIAALLDMKLGGKKCAGMEGLIAEGNESLGEYEEAPMIDLAIISAARRVEHYEMAGYMTASEMAGALGHSDVVALLTETLDEEGAADEKLHEQLLAALGTEEDGDEEDDDEMSDEEDAEMEGELEDEEAAETVEQPQPVSRRGRRR